MKFKTNIFSKAVLLFIFIFSIKLDYYKTPVWGLGLSILRYMNITRKCDDELCLLKEMYTPKLK